MRSYLDIFIDVQDGKKVEYEELRVALMFCRDMLFFTEQDLKKALDNPNPFIKQIIEENRDTYRDWETDRKSTRLNSSHSAKSRMPSSA